MKITWFLALLGGILLLVLLILLELGILRSPFASQSEGYRQKTIPQAPVPPTPSAPTSPTSETEKGRRELVYKLTQKGLVAKEELAKLVKSPVPQFENLDNPHSVGTYKYREEVALRVTALEALDKLARENPAEVQKLLEEIAEIQQDPTLKFLVRISLQGIYSNRPGKLSRTMDAMITEKEKL